MNLFNIRIGFATNSSSSHSMIFRKNTETDWEGESNFGWEDFTLSTKKAKMTYLAVLVFENLKHYYDLPRDILLHITKLITGITIPQRSYIDHQSFMLLPQIRSENNVTYERTSFLDREFIEDLKKFILQKDLVILGGNDNSPPHPLFDETAFWPIGYDRGQLLSRFDPIYKYWTLFWKNTGTKVRLNFKKYSPKMKTPERAFSPELVDLKITDKCIKNCPFCYQGSTPTGGHAKMSYVIHIANTLSELKVFEIAIGGGEPTLHPEFINILEYLNQSGIIANFSTGSIGWIKNVKMCLKILNLIGSCGYSVSTADDIKSLVSIIKYYGLDRNKFKVQYVMGSSNRETFGQIIETAKRFRIDLVLLGYKNSGRGKTFKPEDYKGWFDDILEEGIDSKYTLTWGIHIDTSLASTFKDQLSNDISDLCYYTKEGTFSMYIDAVNSMMGPSSFCDNSKMVPFNPTSVDKQEIAKNFRGF